jgi:phosphatidylinositol alpha 1,6-mannosyltransferase
VNPAPRVAFFTDSFHEVNGVAHTSRHFDAYARRRALPFLSVHAGAKTRVEPAGPVTTLELARSGFGFKLETDMSFDLAFLRHRGMVARQLKEFGADLIHITGPSDVGILGMLLAHQLRIPLVASWHTNIHEFGGRRLSKTLSFLPQGISRPIAKFVESDVILALSLAYYSVARVLLAPNHELVDMLHQRTHRPAFLMQRGVDTKVFSPCKRDRTAGPLTIGFVGRLSPEKNVRALLAVEQALLAAGIQDFSISVVGDGKERAWLEENVKHVHCHGLLFGEDLSRAYANMDIFAFPSHTDTFGNVVLEALASGVPTVVTSGGGPKYLVNHSVTGFVAADEQQFAAYVVELAKDPGKLETMSMRAREYALCRYWDRIFDQVYDAYQYCLRAKRPLAPRQAAAAAGRSLA